MPSLVPGFDYDIFISYRQNDNRSGWVTEFVNRLNAELAATIKSPVSVYFDSNPQDGLLETHTVDKSLEGKLRCVIFIPVLSHTYCDVKSFAWNNEFCIFCNLTETDHLGRHVRLHSGNIASRILPVQIHDLDVKDITLFEEQSGGPLRAVDFIFRSAGVNRPLTPHDTRQDNLNKTFYPDQLNKTANAIDHILEAVTSAAAKISLPIAEKKTTSKDSSWKRIWNELTRRNVVRAALVYIAAAVLLRQSLVYWTSLLQLEERTINFITWVLVAGWILAVGLAWHFEASPAGFIRTTSPQSAANPFPPNRKKPLTGRFTVLMLIGALIIQFFYFTYLKPATVRAEIDGAGNEIIPIAVLPFENRSGSEGDRYIAEGITDEIINRLTIISKFRVTNGGRALGYQGKNLAMDKVAKELAVEVIVVGSVDRVGDQITVRAQLMDGLNNFIWANTFQRTTGNIMLVQSEIAEIIAGQLKVQVDQGEKERLHVKPTGNATAYDYYLRGRSKYYKYTSAANDSAIAFFKMALALDPKYARAWAGLGDAYSQMNMRFSREEHWLDSSLVAGARAIKLDSNLSDAYKALANAFSYRKQYDRAYPLLVKAVKLNPTNDQAVGNLGTNYLLRGDLPTALVWEHRSAGMNPGNWIPYQLIGWIYRLLGDLESAESWLKESLKLKPTMYDTYELLGYTYVAQGRRQQALSLVPEVLKIGNDPRALEVAGLISHYAGDGQRALEYFRKSIEQNPAYKDDPNTVSPIGLGQLLLQEGKKVEAEVYLTHAMNVNLDQVSKGSQSYEPSFYIAGIHAIRGNREPALAWLQKAIDLNWVDYSHFVNGPYFAKYRNDPAFLEKISAVKAKVASMRKKAEANKTEAG